MKPHRADGVSLSFGLIFVLVAAWWAVSRVVHLRLPTLGWLIAGMLILFGMIGLLRAIRSGRRAEPVQATTTEPAPDDTAAGGLPPQMHADIVRELMENSAERFGRDHPEPSARPATEPPTEPPTEELAARPPTGGRDDSARG
ncbi:hypothetical protein [Mangrovihabitans endophyticus]|uniref:Uncharacterized protein n=1 Tax=Mangrovihabitans endophyticus TaxID=1751298 RepID=A0A8J3C0P9_9ACTN|nr:hypothetical protein [Mangrovihabitans endophyticus]GGK92278.1 hypothetical protein GCM10012284_27640 [Mangrovihabitans endophyticus]